MKRTFRGLLGLAVVACLSLAATCVAAVASTYASVREGIKVFAMAAVKAVAPEPIGTQAPAVHQVQAKAFQARIDKRERPVITSSWRLCPST